MRAPDENIQPRPRLRRAMSLPEVVLWQALRKGQLEGLRFRRQHPIGPYILDFYSPRPVWRLRWMGWHTTPLLGCTTMRTVEHGLRDKG